MFPFIHVTDIFFIHSDKTKRVLFGVALKNKSEVFQRHTEHFFGISQKADNVSDVGGFLKDPVR